MEPKESSGMIQLMDTQNDVFGPPLVIMRNWAGYKNVKARTDVVTSQDIYNLSLVAREYRP